MSNEVYEEDGLYVTRYAGPARDDDRPRTRWQFTVVETDGTAANMSVDRAGLTHLVAVLIKEIAS